MRTQRRTQLKGFANALVRYVGLGLAPGIKAPHEDSVLPTQRFNDRDARPVICTQMLCEPLPFGQESVVKSHLLCVGVVRIEVFR
jgi:hypothetical protein